MDKTGLFHFSLEHPTLAASSRYTRCYGSSWLMKVRLSKEQLSNIDQIKHFFFRPLVLNGQVFRFFYVNKDHNIYLMATAEYYDGALVHSSSSLSNGQTFFCSFLDFFSKHNNLEENSNQVSLVYLDDISSSIYIIDNCKMGSKNSSGIIKFYSWFNGR